MDWHREGGRGGDCADETHCQGWSVTPGALLVAGTGWKRGSRVPYPAVFPPGPGGSWRAGEPCGATGGSGEEEEPRCPGSSCGQEKEGERDRQTAVVREDVNGVS